MVSFTTCKSEEELKTLLEKYSSFEGFQEEFRQACYYYFKYVPNSFVIGTLNPDSNLLYPMIDWIHKQSDNNIQINILKEEDYTYSRNRKFKRCLFTVKLSDAYVEPLTRFATFYLVLVTLRMLDSNEGFTTSFTETPEEFTHETLHILNLETRRHNTNHALYVFQNSRDRYVTFPKEVLSKLFNVELFNKAFSETFFEYNYRPNDDPKKVCLEERMSQTSCILKLCRELKLLDQLDDGTEEKRILGDFNYIYISRTGRSVRLNLGDPLYTSIEDKIKLANKEEKKK